MARRVRRVEPRDRLSIVAPYPASSRAPRAAALALALALIAAGCGERSIEFEGIPGRPFPLAAQDGREVPRMAFTNDGCPGTPGGCSSFCVDDPATCLAADPNACMPALISSANPLTVLPAPDGNVRTGRECFEVRAAEGLGLDPAAEDPLAVARLRFEDPPVLRAPAEAPEGWSWLSGSDETGFAGVGAIVGGNLLNDFAVEMRHEPTDPDTGETPVPTVTWSREFPGSQRSLADQGRAYLRLQYPNRLTGVQLRDQCDFGDEDCQLPELDIAEGRFRIIHERFRMTLDACVAPSPCTVVYEPPVDDPEGEPTCQLRRGPGSLLNCGASDATELGGRGASLVVATEIPGLALVDDSAANLFGQIDALPDCADLGDAPSEIPACIESPDGGALAIPGWAPLEGLMVLRVRGLALVTGSRTASSATPCSRALTRLQGLRAQCDRMAERGEPRSPREDDLQQSRRDDARIDVGLFQTGEVALRVDQDAPDTTRWIRALILPAAAPFVQHTRRDTAGESAQTDGFVGGALLANTEVVLDYTENEAAPGVRVTCLDPGQGTCASIPVCAGSRFNKRSQSCCYGLPQNLIAQTVLDGADKPQPRVEDQCCRALNPRALATLQAEGDFCAGVDPL